VGAVRIEALSWKRLFAKHNMTGIVICFAALSKA
jgi:hypothetical protein